MRYLRCVMPTLTVSTHAQDGQISEEELGPYGPLDTLSPSATIGLSVLLSAAICVGWGGGGGELYW